MCTLYIESVYQINQISKAIMHYDFIVVISIVQLYLFCINWSIFNARRSHDTVSDEVKRYKSTKTYVVQIYYMTKAFLTSET